MSGPGSKPVPLTDEEMKNLGINAKKIAIDYKVGDTIVAVQVFGKIRLARLRVLTKASRR